ncbi:putative protein K02A2.6-like protein [Labeo rohita]|uniref:Gypsy retrotransposon integrase-like protein 1 n=1 Tax=Labeo rohita TaxID=84645 RepID=A0A498M143_LABRO|nr:putative protein K02A2.6-like protein [Labeo rohita]
MEIDTGAAVSLVSDVVYSEILSHLPLKPPDVTLKMYTGESVTMKGLIQVTVELNKQTKKLPLYVVRGDYPSLMGRSWLEQLQVDWQAIHMMTSKTLDLEGVLRKHSEVFKKELGSMEGINVKLTVEPECQPKFLKARPLQYVLKPKVEASLTELVKDGVLEPRLKEYGLRVRKDKCEFFQSAVEYLGHVIDASGLHTEVLKQLHVGHCGMVRMKEIARSYFWWPGVDGQIEEKARTCTSCQSIRNVPQVAPLHPWEYPEKPWHRIHADFAGPVEDKMLLVVMDAYSKWPEVAIMKSTSAEKTIEKLGEIFSRFGPPVQFVSDNGPQFISHEMATFLLANGVQHIKSSPYHPATNGLAESTPHATTKVSPAYLLFNRELRTNFELLKPVTLKETVLQQQKNQVLQRKLRAKDRTFLTGSSVLARNYGSGPKWVPATVETQTGPVSYKVRTAGNLLWRRHTDQLLSGASTFTDLPEGTDVGDQEGVGSPASVTVTTEPTKNPNSPSPKELSTPIVSTENGNLGDRRYPVRERRLPQRFLDYT